MIRTRYALFFRDFVIHDKSIIDEDNRSHYSKFTRLTANGRQRRQTGTISEIGDLSPRKRNKTGVFGENDPRMNHALSFENKGFMRENHDIDLNKMINMQSQHGNKLNNNYMKRSIDPNQLDYSILLEGSGGIMDLRKSILRRNPSKFLAHILKNIFNKKTKQIFEYIKLLMMIKKLRQPNLGGELTKSFIDLKNKVGREKKLSFKLLAIILDRIFTYRSNELKRETMSVLKDKEIEIYKVLFGKVTSVKPQTLTGLDQNSQIANPRKSMINSNSYVNFQRPSNIDQLSINSKLI